MPKKSPAQRWREERDAREELARAEKLVLMRAAALCQPFGFTVEKYKLLARATARRENALALLKSAAKRGRKRK